MVVVPPSFDYFVNFIRCGAELYVMVRVITKVPHRLIRKSLRQEYSVSAAAAATEWLRTRRSLMGASLFALVAFGLRSILPHPSSSPPPPPSSPSPPPFLQRRPLHQQLTLTASEVNDASKGGPPPAIHRCGGAIPTDAADGHSSFPMHALARSQLRPRARPLLAWHRIERDRERR